MKRLTRWAMATLCTGAGLFALTRASAAPVSRMKPGAGRLRLSWSARPERIEVCRTLSDEELAQREEHMRQRVECTGRSATYALRVEADQLILHDAVVRGGGLRHDRPLFVLEDLDVEPGQHRVQVNFTRRESDGGAVTIGNGAARDADTGLFAGRARREVVERDRRARAAIPPTLALDTLLSFDSDAVILISFDPERRALRVTAQP